MDQAILVALVMLVCVLTMLVLGIPISISIGHDNHFCIIRIISIKVSTNSSSNSIDNSTNFLVFKNISHCSFFCIDNLST